MNKIAYYANFAALPLLVVVVLTVNVAKALRFACQKTMVELKNFYRSNKRYYKM